MGDSQGIEGYLLYLADLHCIFLTQLQDKHQTEEFQSLKRIGKFNMYTVLTYIASFTFAYLTVLS